MCYAMQERQRARKRRAPQGHGSLTSLPESQQAADHSAHPDEEVLRRGHARVLPRARRRLAGAREQAVVARAAVHCFA